MNANTVRSIKAALLAALIILATAIYSITPQHTAEAANEVTLKLISKTNMGTGVNAVAINDEGGLAAVCTSKGLVVWRLKNGEPTELYKDTGGACSDTAWEKMPTGYHLAYTINDHLRVLNFKSLRKYDTWTSCSNFRLTWSPGSYIVYLKRCCCTFLELDIYRFVYDHFELRKSLKIGGGEYKLNDIQYVGNDYAVIVGRVVREGRDIGVLFVYKLFSKAAEEYDHDKLGVPGDLDAWFTSVSVSSDHSYIAVSEFYNSLLLVVKLDSSGEPILAAKVNTGFPPTSVVWLDERTIAVGEAGGVVEVYRFYGSSLVRVGSVEVSKDDIIVGSGLSYSPEARLLMVADKGGVVYFYKVYGVETAQPATTSGQQAAAAATTTAAAGGSSGAATVTVTETVTSVVTRTVTKTVTGPIRTVTVTRWYAVTKTWPVTVTKTKYLTQTYYTSLPPVTYYKTTTVTHVERSITTMTLTVPIWVTTVKTVFATKTLTTTALKTYVKTKTAAAGGMPSMEAIVIAVVILAAGAFIGRVRR